MSQSSCSSERASQRQGQGEALGGLAYRLGVWVCTVLQQQLGYIGSTIGGCVVKRCLVAPVEHIDRGAELQQRPHGSDRAR